MKNKLDINEFILMDELKAQLKYWSGRLKDNVSKDDILYDYTKLNQVKEYKDMEIMLPKDFEENVLKICKNNDFNLMVFLSSILKCMLKKYYGLNESFIITPLLKDQYTDGYNGCVLIDTKIEDEMSLKKVVLQESQNFKQAFINGDYPLELILKSLGMSINSSKESFKIGFLYKNLQEYEFIEAYEFGLLFIFDKTSEGIKLEIKYDVNKYNDLEVKNIFDRYIFIAANLLDNVDLDIKSIKSINLSERDKLLYEFNNAKDDYHKNKTIKELFEEQVNRTPEKVAVVFEGRKLTYRQLNHRANSLAISLRESGVKEDTIVAIMLERSIEMIVGIVAVLKSGGAYLPIDTEYPSERIEYMLDDSKAKTLVTEDSLKNKVNFDGLVIDIKDESLYENDTNNLVTVCNPNSLAYVIYTSGTTGKPKGVAIQHRSLINYKTWFSKTIGLSEADKSVLLSSYAFDLSYTTLYSALLSGCELHVISKDIYMEPDLLVSYFFENQITYIKLTPSLFSMIITSNKYKKLPMYSYLRAIVIGGEAINVDDVENYLSRYPDTLILNHYGPTETTIGTAACLINRFNIKEFKQRPNIGKPISNAKAYILGVNNELLPIGVAGELCIGGDGLARGYLYRDDVTKSKFIVNPFNDEEKLYKTGDLAKWLPDGSIEYLGRLDNQVKIRGYRVEIEEIEIQILKLKNIKAVSILLKADNSGEKFLCAYIVVNKKINISELKEELKKYLPSYMIPSYIIEIDKMPITQNGKIDKRSLEKIDISQTAKDNYEEPKSYVEKKLASIWERVLKKEQIGINDDFFECGGHSLKAAILASEIRAELDVEISVKEIFSNPILVSLGKLIESKNKHEYIRIKRAEEQEYYKPSSAEKRIYTLWEMNKNSVEYNMPLFIEYKKEINKDKVEKTLNEIINRHEALRTSFRIIDRELVQKINQECKLDFKYKEISRANINDEISSFVKPFDLEKAPLLRGKLVKLEDKDYVLMLDFHHIVVDGVSRALIMDEFNRIYNGQSVEELEIQYKDYSEWQNSKEQQEALKIQEQYWLKRFENDVPVLNLITDYERPKVKKSEGSKVDFEISEGLAFKLNDLAKQTGSTLYMVLLSAFNILLSKYSGQEDIVVGTVEAGRVRLELKNVVGMFVNTMVLRNYPSGNKAYRDFLEEVKDNTINDFDNREYQFENLVDKLNIKRDASRNPMFDVMFVLENMNDGNGDISNISLGLEISKFDITLAACELENSIKFNLEYSVNLFKKDTIERMITSYVNILTCVAERSDVKLSEIDMLSKEEKNKVIYEFNATNRAYESGKTIQELFEEQVVKTPDNIVVGYENCHLTYKQLNEKANSLARVLRQKGISSESIVGIMMERSVDMLVGIMGILKSGGAYLPIDPEYPEDRIKYMLTDSNAKILLTQTKLMEKVDFSGETINLDDKELYGRDNSNLDKVCCEENLAYVIYTSGTTGNPKGVMVEHKALVNLCNWHNDYYEVSEKDKATKYAGFAFDASVWEIFPYLIKGAAIEIIPKDIMLDVERLHEYYNEKGITISFLPTQVCEQFINFESKSLRVLLTGADKLKTYKETNYKLVNNYGPTENTVVSTSFIVDKQYKNIPIGKPIQNTSVYILSKDGETAPIGVPGELCVAGANLARGYINREELTREKFVDNPFEPGKKMYKTGDLARWLADGNIEYLGRIDNQVKIRGFRIEIAEIEVAVQKNEKIQSCAIVCIDNKLGEKDLILYYVVKEDISSNELRQYLRAILPIYMIPQEFIQVEKIPITFNGKVDLKAISKMEAINSDSEDLKEEETTEVEKSIKNIWVNIIGNEKIAIYDNFFDIGGDSMKLISMHNELKKLYSDRVIEVADIFAYPTINSLATFIQQAEQKSTRANKVLETVEFKDEYIVSDRKLSKSRVLKYKMSSEAINMMNKLCKNNNFKKEHLFLASYVFLLAQASKKKEININVLLNSDDVVSEIKIDISKIKNFYEIISLMEKELEKCKDDSKYRLSLSRLERRESNYNSRTVIFASVDRFDRNQFNNYDLIIAFSTINNEFECLYNEKNLKDDRIHVLFNNYANLINKVIGVTK
ncbi:hypothetical protein CSC2_08540 [Clostridium zeae]|uniref:Carrier domain-containing protein n=1 Tax=Clostridium zeae TaxID=2759022 RepID=A0ABQ1E6G8_9CLOT|nr:non-ribosomal peptide synthetase [Clostridium zeae]GFZ30328.1 hypothetical protein CSC2_08540 [Clostridium zeae]